MRRTLRATLFALVTLVVAATGRAGTGMAEKADARVVATSGSAAFRVEQRGNQYWCVSASDPAGAEQIPLPSAGSAPLEFYFSPNDEWLFELDKGESCRREGSLFHRERSGTIRVVEAFDARAWAQGAKFGAYAVDFYAHGECAMMRFIGWSLDSGRLLVGLRGGGGDFEMDADYLYFNTRTRRFELTRYLLKLNRITTDILSAPDDVLACVEPPGALPTAAELKARLEKLEAKLNATCSRLTDPTNGDAESIRAGQTVWLKQREAGLKLYLSFVKPDEKERRRLQYLGDVAAMRLALPPQEWATGPTWPY